MKIKKKLVKLAEAIIENPITALAIPAVFGAGSFITNAFIVLSNGDIDSNSLHNLLSGANGFQTVVIGFIMIALQARKSGK